MALYLEQFLPLIGGSSKGAPSTIRITHNKMRDLNLLGITENDVTVSLQNQFGSLLPDVTTLQDIQYLFNSANITAFAMTTNQVWKGTAPLSFSLDFYVINYKPNLNYESQLKRLSELCTLVPNGKMGVFIHGGYYPNFFTSNTEMNKKGNNNDNVQQEDGNNSDNVWSDVLAGAVSQLDKVTGTNDRTWRDIIGGQYPGTLTVQVGSNLRLSNLLITKIDITPSIVEVCDNGNGNGAKPLYYRIGASFMTCRAAMQSDVSGIFGG